MKKAKEEEIAAKEILAEKNDKANKTLRNLKEDFLLRKAKKKMPRKQHQGKHQKR